MLFRNLNEENRQVWIKKTLFLLPQGGGFLMQGLANCATVHSAII